MSAKERRERWEAKCKALGVCRTCAKGPRVRGGRCEPCNDNLRARHVSSRDRIPTFNDFLRLKGEA